MEKAHVFVADADKPFLNLMQELLQHEGYRVTVLRSVYRAYKEIKEAAPDLVILEIVLLQVDRGWAVLEHLKLDPATSNTPVIVCSADWQSLHENEDALLKRGCFILKKPFDLDELLAQVETALASRSGTDSIS